jgi:outer membrane protein OmpA-like peptidoglycan-associated protein
MQFALSSPSTPVPKYEVATGDFPDLPPLPGSNYRSGAKKDQPMRIEVTSTDGKRENTVVANSSVAKTYFSPDLSNLQFVSVYRGAMEQAGWSIVSQQQGLHQGDAVLVSHFGKNGRNLWAYLRSAGGEYTLQLGEDATDDLARQFSATCRAVLNGVVFDFDKATLRPESDAALTNALALLKTAGNAGIEVQGHTDNVGREEYNQKLSEARAETVAAWFTDHGISRGRMVSRGYGSGKPVADNGTPEGRARNRRVEIVRTDCKM